MAMPATTMPAIMPKNIASKNGIDRRNRRRIHCSCAPGGGRDSRGRGAPHRRELWQLRVARLNAFYAEHMAALIAWMLVVRVGDLVKDGAKRRRLRRSTILDKIANANTVLSKRSRPFSRPSYIYLILDMSRRE
jgi:hypothetical protein